MAILVGEPIVYGIQDVLPLKDFPEGKYRIRLRNYDWARVYVKTKESIREFLVKEQEGSWIPAVEVGSNTENKQAT